MSVICIFIKDTQYCINSGEYSDNVCEDSASIIQETLKIWDTETFCDAESLCSLTTAVNVDRKTQAPETWRHEWNLVRKLTNFDK